MGLAARGPLQPPAPRGWRGPGGGLAGIAVDSDRGAWKVPTMSGTAIGNTPLIRLRRASEATGCEILGKAEFMNPGGSVKDRAALAIILRRRAAGRAPARRHHRRGHGGQHRHRPGAGRRTRCGYRTVIVIPETQCQEKKDMLRLAGADAASRCPRCPTAIRTTTCTSPAGWRNSLAAHEPIGAIWANQFDNVANRQAHYRDDRPGDLGPDRRQDRRVHLRGGTGGTLAGVAQALRSAART